MPQLQPEAKRSITTRGHAWSNLASAVSSPASASSNSDQQLLTPRRRQVLTRYLRGETRDEIATRLGVSPNTIRNHIRLVYEELGLTNRVEALRWALEQPAIAQRLLMQEANSDELDSTERSRGRRERPPTIEQMIDEAITFFQQEVIDSPLESA